MPTKNNATFESKINSLRNGYIASLKKYVEQLKIIFNLSQKNKFKAKDREKLLEISHKLAGSGAMFGFSKISKIGNDLQNFLKNERDKKANDVVKKISALIDACNEAIKSDNLNIGDNSKNLEIEKNPEVLQEKLPVVLLIDDDDNIRNLIQELLKDDAKVVDKKNAENFLDVIKENNPDIIILDNILPDKISGLQILEKIQSTAQIKDIPVIMLTSSGESEKVVQGLMLGAVDYITKPFDPKKLLKKIKGRLQRLNKRILIADDDEIILELLRHKFISAGCNVTCVADGKAAWQKIQEEKFALIILDCMMPGFDGISILNMMKEDAKLSNIPLIFLTSKHSNEDIMEGLDAGAADYICKPFNPDEVVARAIKVLEKSSGESQ